MSLALAAALLLAPDAAADTVHAALDRLAGCWDAPGEVMGKRVATRVRGAWPLAAATCCSSRTGSPRRSL